MREDVNPTREDEKDRVREGDRVRMEGFPFPVPSSLAPYYFSLYPPFSLATSESTDDRLQPRHEVIILNIHFFYLVKGGESVARLRENKEDRLRPDM